MFNYSEIDKYVSVEHLNILMDWINKNTNHHYMISDIIRNGDVYKVSFTDAGTGFNRTLDVSSGKAERIKKEEEGFWMS